MNSKSNKLLTAIIALCVVMVSVFIVINGVFTNLLADVSTKIKPLID